MLDIEFEKKTMNVGLNRISLKRVEIDLILGFVHRVVVVVAKPDLKIGQSELRF